MFNYVLLLRQAKFTCQLPDSRRICEEKDSAKVAVFSELRKKVSRRLYTFARWVKIIFVGRCTATQKDMYLWYM